MLRVLKKKIISILIIIIILNNEIIGFIFIIKLKEDIR